MGLSTTKERVQFKVGQLHRFGPVVSRKQQGRRAWREKAGNLVVARKRGRGRWRSGAQAKCAA